MLELIFQGFMEWAYGLTLECWEYFSSSLLGIMSMDYLRETFPELRYDQNKAREVFLAWIKSFEEREGGASC